MDREQIARVIKPSAFNPTFAARKARAWGSEQEAAAFQQILRDEALKKADAILSLAATGGTGAEGWRPISEYVGHHAVLVSRPTDRLTYSATTAFFDATNVWRVFRSEVGMTPLPFVPTHFMELPASPTGEQS